MRSIAGWLLVSFIVPSAGRLAAQQQSDAPLARLVQDVAIDSLNGAGQRVDQQYFATDSATWRLLRDGRTRASLRGWPKVLGCPGASLSGSFTPVGYVVTVSVTPEPGDSTARLSITKSCVYPPDATKPFAFQNGGVWIIRRTATGWMIARLVEIFIT